MPHIPDHLLDNPLVNPGDLPHGVPAYDRIKAEHFVPAVDWAIHLADARLKAVKSSRKKVGFNTLYEIIFADEELSRIWSIVNEINNVAKTPEVKNAYEAANEKVTDFSLRVGQDRALFKKIDRLFQSRDTLDLPEGYRVSLEKMHQAGIDNGINLKGKDRKTYLSLSKRLSKAQEKFSNNVSDDTDEKYVVVAAGDDARLRGVPAGALDFYRSKAAEKGLPEGTYLIPMSPMPIAILKNAEDPGLREEVFAVFKSIASEGRYDNGPVFKEIHSLRHQIATLFGYDNHADYTISTGRRMVSDYNKVYDFVKTNAAIYRAGAKDIYDAMESMARADGLPELRPCDMNYYLDKLKERECSYDENAARNYFTLENALKGMLTTFEKVYDVTMTDVTGKYPTLHPSIRTYDVHDAKTNAAKAILYVDLFARPGKRGGAWMADTRNAGLLRGSYQTPIASIHMNLMEEETPRLTPDDVETLFHEAGHGFHCLMGMDEVPGVNGTNTGWDYVELPSQFMESFAFKRTLLDTYAFHYQTGAVIPQETLDQILKAKTFDAAYMGARQTMFGIVDLAIHTTAPEEIDDLKTFEDKALEGYRIGKPNTLPSLYNSFTHIAGGYAAGYYVYKWADAIVANARDPFERREAQTGEIFPPDLCKAFAEHMIKPGGKIPSAQMLANFKQAAGCNDTSLDPLALFRAEGIAVPAEIETKILRQQANPKP